MSEIDQSQKIGEWLKMLHEERGSDLFITVGAPPCIKVNGRIRPVSDESLGPDEASQIVLDTMNETQIRQFEEERELQYAVSIAGFARFRMSAFFQRALKPGFRPLKNSICPRTWPIWR